MSGHDTLAPSAESGSPGRQSRPSVRLTGAKNTGFDSFSSHLPSLRRRGPLYYDKALSRLIRSRNELLLQLTFFSLEGMVFILWKTAHRHL